MDILVIRLVLDTVALAKHLSGVKNSLLRVSCD